MGYQVDNAVIMAAGLSSRFAPLSYERPKALITVKGEVLIERQIRQLREAGIREIILVAGYKKEQFYYLREKYGVIEIENPEYLTRNNNSSIYATRKYLKNSYICSADNYFAKNPFEKEVEDSYYAAVYAEGATEEWCMTSDREGYITGVQVGGKDAWYMLGHVFWSEKFSRRFLEILEREYDRAETRDKLWESIFIEHLRELPMKIRKYPKNEIYEFDSLDELRQFDTSYISDTRSEILKEIAGKLSGTEAEIQDIRAYKAGNAAAGFTFDFRGKKYRYSYEDEKLGEERA